MVRDYKNNAKVFKAFCDENRLRIIEQLKSGETCACVLLLTMPINQSTLSHHMKILVESNIVDARRDGKWIHYSLSEIGIEYAKKILIEISELESSNDGAYGCTARK